MHHKELFDIELKNFLNFCNDIGLVDVMLIFKDLDTGEILANSNQKRCRILDETINYQEIKKHFAGKI